MHLTSQVSPSQSIIDKESEHILLSFCTYCMLIKGKRLSLQNVFILVLDDKKINQLLKDLLGVDSDYDVVKIFLNFDNSITRSKFVTKYLNARNRKNANK